MSGSAVFRVGAVAVLLSAILFQFSCSDPGPEPLTQRTHTITHERGTPPARIISLAPSVTEVLFELGLGDRVVGVTRFCQFPSGAREKQKVGGYFDISYESVLALEPDLVILLREHEDARERLEGLGIAALAVDHSRVEGILDSITVMARASGVEGRGSELRADIEKKILRIKDGIAPAPPHPIVSPSAGRPAARSKPRVLVAVGRSLQAGGGGEIYVSGRDGFYDDLVTLAGGENAYREETLKFPAFSAEGLARMDPDVVIEMVPDLSPGEDREPLLAFWEGMPGLRAAREGRVHILGGDLTVVPGPRFVDLLEEMAKVIKKEEGRGNWEGGRREDER